MNTPSTLHQVLLQPTDVLFFRDGRPMAGSLAGHTAAWPLPDVTNHALHAALHRAGFSGVHAHRSGRSGRYCNQRDRKFGCLTTAGPFPVAVADEQGRPLPVPRWFFPRPRDTIRAGTVAVALHPVSGNWRDTSSLPAPLVYAVANTQPPAKETAAEPWISTAAYQRYLGGDPSEPSEGSDYLRDTALADTEQTIGIAIDPETQTTGQGEAAGRIYSAHYLRLRGGYRLGLFAEAMDKVNGDPSNKRDLIRLLLNDHPQSIVVGGQQRLCTAIRRDVPQPLPLPCGLHHPDAFVRLSNGKFAVKWVLLTPAIWPEMSGEGKQPHPGGWLPNWIDSQTGAVLLKAGDTTRREGEGREAWRKRVREMRSVSARLVAAIVPKPIPVTGWALPNDSDRPEGGAKSTHLAVPAGAVYYFEADTAEAAVQLAAALNWHGDTSGRAIVNRRSTLLGEKGYGLGVCGTWQFYPGPAASDRAG